MAPVSRPQDHDFRVDDWWGRRDCERQRALRKIAPMSFGSVLIVRNDMDEETIRWHLRTMKEHGFTSIKQFMGCTRWSMDQLETLALEEGLCPWWYGDGGWEGITDELCEQLGIDSALLIDEIRQHPAMIAHQKEVFRKRVGWDRIKLNPEQQAGFHADGETERPGARAFGADAALPEWAVPHFIDWLRHEYNDDLDALSDAWNTSQHKTPSGATFTSWEEVAEHHKVDKAREYCRVRDVLRFKAAIKAQDVTTLCAESLARDPWEANRVGGEMGLFLPFASRGTDMELLADAVKETGSFYPSIHLAWHFEETYFEVAKPVYMQAAIVVDWNKGGWTASWESTGGPQQTSGAKAFLFPEVADEQPGFTVDVGTMTQLFLSYLAAGCKGAGVWSWNARLAGWEGGEFALLDRNEQVCERTVRAGSIAKAAEKYRDELWQAVREPQVGILTDFDSEAIWAAMGVGGRTKFKYRGVETRIGADRACIDGSLTLEHVTGRDLEDGLLSRYPILFMPSIVGLKRSHLPVLKEYVEQGGRLVLDMPGGCYDERGKVLFTKAGTDFEQLFGCELQDLQYSGNNVDWSIDGMPLFGYTADLKPTTAQVVASYDTGRPAMTEHQLGKGTAVILGWEAARSCYLPGNDLAQQRLVDALLGGAQPFYKLDGDAVAYRLAAPEVDHYFLINEGDASENTFSRLPYEYRSVTDVLTGESINLSQPVGVAKANGRWLRAEK
jgi:beta-galactosidase